MVDTSRFTVDSLILNFHDGGLLKLTLDKNKLNPTNATILLNTTYFDTILPGIAARFGKDQPVTVDLATKESPVSYMKPGQIGLDLTGTITVKVNGQTACILDIISAQTVVAATLKNFIFTVQFVSFCINDSQVVESEFGTIDLDAKRRFINFMAYITLPVINKLLENGVVIPNEFFGMIRIQDALFESKDGYVSVGIVPQFIPYV